MSDKKKRILLVGEQSEELLRVRAALREAGYQLDAAPDVKIGTTGVIREIPDLVIIDLPRSTAKVRQACGNLIEEANRLFIPTMLITSQEEQQKIGEGEKLEVSELLLRPVSETELLRRVRSLLKIKELQEQLRELGYSLRQDQKRLLLDLDLARKAEMRLLPRTLPEIAELKFEAYYEASEKVGGDLYDVVELGKREVAIFIADAAGKGVPAALLIALTKMSFRSFCEVTSSPRVIMERTNQLLGEVARPEDFVTAFLAVMDKSTLTMSYINASHPPPLLIRDGKLEELETEGFLLGIGGDANYEQREIQLQPGDKLLLYTNGVLDVVNPAGELYLKKRLHEQIADLADRGIAELVNAIRRHLDKFSAGAARRDDLTLLGLEVVTPPEEHHRLVLESSSAQVEPTIRQVTEIAQRNQFSNHLLFNVRLGVVEALRNAIEHGNKMDPNKKVILEMSVDSEKVVVTVTDEGQGFDYNNLPDPTTPDSLLQERGRGIFLIRVCMDKVEFTRKGSQIRMLKYR